MLPDARRDGPLRLLWLIDSLTLGGAEALTLRMGRALDRTPARLRVACLKAIGGNPFEAELRAAGVAVHNLGARNLRDFRAFRRLIGLVRRERVDLIHAHLTYACIWGCLAGRLTGVPVVATLHVAPLDPGRGGRERARQRIRVWCLNRWAARTLAVSRWVGDAWVRQAGLDPAGLTVVHNGIDCDPPSSPRSPGKLRAELGLPVDARLVVAVAALRDGKGLDVLLHAAPRILSRERRARFVVVGDGPLRQTLQEACQRSGLAAVFRFTGFRRDVPALLPGCDVFVLPTRRDAFPTAVLEGMAAGLPVVASRVGGVPEMIEDGESGLLVAPGDAGALADAVVDLLARPDECARLGRAARRRAVAEFSTEAWLARLEAVYGPALSTGARGSPVAPHRTSLRTGHTVPVRTASGSAAGDVS